MSTALDRLPAAPASRVSQVTAVEQSRAVAEVQAAIVVAQNCPRDMVRAWAEMRAACGRLALANRAFYTVPNRGIGPSVHLARELARIWGNLDHGVKELRRDDDGHESEVQAYAWDQQTNVRSTRSMFVPHVRMAGGARKPLTDLTDIYLNNQNVGARAVRECIFTVLPSDFVAEAQELCRATIERGDGKPLDQRIAAMVEAFSGIGVKVSQIEARIGKPRGQWTPVDLADLSVVWSSIKRGEVKTDEEFPAERVTANDIAATRPLAPTTPEPPIDADDAEEPAPEPESEPDSPMITAPQQKKLHALLRDLGLSDRERGLARIGEILGRELSTTKDLTKVDAGIVIDVLESLAEGPELEVEPEVEL